MPNDHRNSTLQPGLYDAVLTAALRQAIDGAGNELVATIGTLDPGDAHEVLARHFSGLFQRVFASLPTTQRPQAQVDLANRLIGQLATLAAPAVEDGDRIEPAVLKEVAARDPLRGPRPLRHPGVPLSQSALLTNARGEYGLGHELALEIESADRVDLLCSFIKWSGINVLRDALETHLRNGRPLRIITTTYLGATDRRALDELARLGAEIRVSFDTRRTRLHAKAWLFERKTGFTTAYVGSSNLSASAQTHGLEWNVRISAVDAPQIVEKFVGTFESYWADADFEPYDASEAARERFDRAVQSERAETDEPAIAFFDIRPWPFQEEVLERLALERETYGRTRNLVVAATGTGKTVIAALDYRRRCETLGRKPRLLFVAHRAEILRQSLLTFRAVLRGQGFGEEWVDSRRPSDFEHVFASIQSLSRADLDRFPPDHFEFVIVDEFHHAAAPTYERLLRRLNPDILVGLTATPERADGESILHWFGDHIAAELRIWDAIDRGLLVPFQYFGVSDGTDLRNVRWVRGRYDERELEGLYTGNHLRVNLILNEVAKRIRSVREMRALGFCVGVQHAEFMADSFNRAGIPATVVTGSTSTDDRKSAIERLRDRELNVLFSVDVFSEGVDIPEVDTVLLLRPTQSATVFLQQLGRGLRLAERKDCLTVLDFVGNGHAEFRADLGLRAILDVSRRQLERQIEAGFPLLPSGCTISLDKQSRELILDNLKRSLHLRSNRLLAEVRRLGPDASLREVLADLGSELPEFYRGGRSLTDLRRGAAFAVAAGDSREDQMARYIPRILHVDDPERLASYRALLLRQVVADPGDERGQRHLLMLATSLLGPQAALDPAECLDAFARNEALAEEITQILDLLSERIEHVSGSVALPHEIPLRLHARYTRTEIMAAFGDVRRGGLYEPREGVYHHPDTQSDLFFVTIQKSEADYSPSTLYKDYAISPDEFHWQSQSTTRSGSDTGQRYINHVDRGYTPFLFVRERNDTEYGHTMPYLFLGPVDYVSHEGDRPMSIRWKMRARIPADAYRGMRLTA